MIRRMAGALLQPLGYFLFEKPERRPLFHPPGQHTEVQMGWWMGEWSDARRGERGESAEDQRRLLR